MKVLCRGSCVEGAMETLPCKAGCQSYNQWPLPSVEVVTPRMLPGFGGWPAGGMALVTSCEILHSHLASVLEGRNDWLGFRWQLTQELDANPRSSAGVQRSCHF